MSGIDNRCLTSLQASQYKRRKPIIALLFSLVTTGLGQIYNGQPWKGISFHFCFYVILVLLSKIGLLLKYSGMIVTVVILTAVWLLIIGDAFITAGKMKEFELKSYNKWYVYLGFVLFCTLLILPIIKLRVFPRILPVKTYKMSSKSMEPTIFKGEMIMADLRYYEYRQPKRGDLVVFKYPLEPKKDFMKRCIGLSGDTIEIKNKKVYINGELLEEKYTVFNDTGQILPSGLSVRDNFGPVTIPADSFFVMGDNRDRTLDSRFFGFVDEALIKGKPIYIYWSHNKKRLGLQVK